ncbi:protein RDM16-like isoform X1 [Vicia villosa]|uniref:protein RDM16-like isoform X1 n=2 Tax=Vicia villosa TaxID=3911 RepID=UPI00273B201D|nr:protein RDM16-like isoform X1 [Vicia villosa]XP_058728782.1 protein RDM16-like isoform X1 [Vicia villosa]XP_058728783.1 protein RDM16-like isoform X1 [Vicia villosa]XP_058728784.1 protein RDM16-like isoform X1 [Vicia villosa]
MDDRDKSERRNRDRHSDRDHKHHRSRHDSDDHRHHRSDRNAKHEHKTREDREGSRDRVYDRDEREGSKGRSKVKRDEEREDSVEPRHSSHSHKRKDREHSEDRDLEDKRIRVSEEKREVKKERRKFGDKVKKDEDYDNEPKIKEEVTNGAHGFASPKDNASVHNGVAVGSPAAVHDSVPETSLPPPPPFPLKVSSISTTNENKGVSIARSHEVTGKSSTDGSSSTAGKPGSLSIDALAKAKKTSQMQKELTERLKRFPQLNKSSTSNLGQKTESTTTPSLSAGVASRPATSSSSGPVANMPIFPTAAANPPAGSTSLAGVATATNIEAVRRAQELAARMGFRHDPQFAPVINMFPGQTVIPDGTIPQKPTKAPVLRLDAQGREIDEHGNVVSVAKPSNLSTLKVNINKQKKDAFEILKPVLEVDPESNPHFDERMGIDKTKLLRPKRMNFLFVEEGKWSRDAESIKLKSKFGEAQAKEQKAKQAQLAKANAAPDINPNLIEITERVVIKEKLKDQIPEIEWWDVGLLLSGNYGDIANGTIGEDILKMEKITFYVEHPRPIEPPAEPAPPPPQPLKLTKKEQKKLRTQRRIAKQKERQEMIRQGVIEPPKPKVKMSNLMKVLGTEATQDPTRLEKEVRNAAAEREQAHIDRNIARKLTPAELREKKERKLFDDPNTLDTLVSLYRINDLSHPKARFSVDVNAQENRLTGCSVICDGVSVVVVEGGSKSIKRYGKLMLRRINWSDFSKKKEEDEDSDDDKPANKCVLVWQGSIAKPSFNRFSVHDCITEAAARKVFVDAGVPHYWDQAVNYVDDEAA